MSKKFLPFVCLFVIANLTAQQRPKLVVGIVVDQMKMEYLYRFQNDFSENGFKRLMNKGYTFYNMHYNYMPTYTAPGHASIYTGTTPAMHGIVSNEWYSRSAGKEVYCTDDASVKTLGDGTKEEGEMSPKNLQTTTITDELRLSTNFKGKVIGISMKDRGAILPAGHFANWAFWYSKTGSFISSTFYGEKLPDWVTDFNAQKGYMKYINQGWNLLKPIATYDESLADDNPYEGKLYKVDKPVFPYDLKAMLEKNNPSILRATPFGNDYVADFAKAAIEKEALGKDDVTDFLAVSFSSTDYVGHILGPRSMELQDTYLRLDLTIADFLIYLDKTVGKGNYLVFLTADHAGAENARFLNDNKYDVTNIDIKEATKNLKKFSTDTFGDDLVLNYDSFNLFFDKNKIKTKGLDLVKVKQAFKDFLMTQNYVKRVYTEEEILANSGADYHLNCIAKGYDATQNGDMVVLDKPGYIEYGPTGTSHGTTYSYDTNVPLLFYGWKIPKGESHEKKVITQIAPTLSQKLKITLPNGTESEVLSEILDK
ncbi:alkaline phosphatase PafA [Flavobacterium sp.]|uniref:alkaline phosphatase PafA n=1 Tax=Flavobacterium sp. TaxID=239 RepID=UPI0025D10CD5|nr:alkaline phosphatase PafA [Flavobacterium sp.]